MNKAQQDVIERAIVNYQDDLYRYSMAEKKHPGSKTGNGEPFTDIIAELTHKIAELRGQS